jgi:DNA-binding transcriptional regulator YdaS (Cro superfamily)
MDQTPICRAVAAFDSQAAFAKAVGVHPSFVSQWVTGRRPVPAKLCKRIEDEVARIGGSVTRFELCPDVFGPAPKRGKAA